MTRDEQEAINTLRNYVKDFEYEGKYPYLVDSIICIDNLIDKQQKENEELKDIYLRVAKCQEKKGNIEFAEYLLAQISAVPTFVTMNKEEIKADIPKLNHDYISKDKIKKILNYEENENPTEEVLLITINTMWEEFNRLEDIEDKMILTCISKDKIRDKIKELEEDREKVRNIYEPSDDDGEFIQTYQILVLKELLEEE